MVPGENSIFGNFSPGGSRDTLHYCQGLIETLKKKKLVTSSFYCQLPENPTDHGL